MSAKTYDLVNCQLIVGTVPVRGFGPDDVMTMEYPSERVQSDVTADGEVTYSRLNDRRVRLTITVSETSLAYKLLAAELQAQHPIAGGAIAPKAFLFRDNINGDEVSDAECVFITDPTINKGRTKGEREFLIELPNGRLGLKFGTLISN